MGERGPVAEKQQNAVVKTGKPTAPAHIKGQALVEWRRLCSALHKVGLLTTFDRATLAGYCSAYKRYVDAEKALAKHGLTQIKEDRSGKQYRDRSPEVQIVKDAMIDMRAFCKELGLTPSSRGKIWLPEPERKDKLTEWKKGREAKKAAKK